MPYYLFCLPWVDGLITLLDYFFVVTKVESLREYALMDYEAVVGLEVHIQLKLPSKIFTSVPFDYGVRCNTLVDPQVLGLPGSLPSMSTEALHSAVLLGLSLGCEVATSCGWDRKNYFYPDNSKNYQISQHREPLLMGGFVEIELPGSSRKFMGEHKRIALHHIHLEEDVGKLTHGASATLVDYNRAGLALAEIVSEPHLSSPEEAFAFVVALRNVAVAAGVSDADMEKGQLRCDANISVRPSGQAELNPRVEIKNLNSTSGVRNAIEYEIRRQTDLYRSGQSVMQQTRRWDADRAISSPLRQKENSEDYRYFKDPDIPRIVFRASELEALRGELSEMPFDRQRRYQKDYKLPYTITSVLCANRELYEFFEAALDGADKPTGSAAGGEIDAELVAKFVVNELIGAASVEGEARLELSNIPITPTHLGQLARLIQEGRLTRHIAKTVWARMLDTGEMPLAIVEQMGLDDAAGGDELQALIAKVLQNPENQKTIAKVKAGNAKALNALMGLAMKAAEGKADPQALRELLRAALEVSG